MTLATGWLGLAALVSAVAIPLESVAAQCPPDTIAHDPPGVSTDGSFMVGPVRYDSTTEGGSAHVSVDVSGPGFSDEQLISWGYDPSEFRATGLQYEWDFGDGSELVRTNESGAGHPYLDQPPSCRNSQVPRCSGVYDVTVTVTDTRGRGPCPMRLAPTGRGRGAVEVFNAPPVLDSVWYEGDAEVNQTLTFRTRVTERGVLDTLRYSWVFGDGGTSFDSVPRHAYAKDGLYSVRFQVYDGDGGKTEGELLVIVGEGGAIDATGDVGFPTTEISGSTVTGTPLENGMCQVSVHLSVEDHGDITFQGVLPGGLRYGRYAIDAARAVAGSWDQNMERPGWLTAYFGFTRNHDLPDRSLFDFQSVTGDMLVGRSDGARLSGVFEVDFVENTDPSFNPQHTKAVGYFRLPVSNRFMGPGSVPNHFYACQAVPPPR